MPGQPIASLYIALPLGDAARGRHKQRESEVGGRLRQDAGRVAYRYAPLVGGGNVNVVEADRHVADDLQIRARVHKRGVNAVGEQAEQAIQLANFAQDNLIFGRKKSSQTSSAQ